VLFLQNCIFSETAQTFSKFETEIWSQTELDLNSPVSDQMTVMHVDIQLSVIA